MFCVGLLYLNPCIAQSFFAGNTYENFGGEPIVSGVQIALKSCAYEIDENGQKVGWTTVEDGMFFLQLAAGTHEIEITYGGNKSYVEVDLKEGEILRKDLFLSKEKHPFPVGNSEVHLEAENFLFDGKWKLKSMRVSPSIRDSLSDWNQVFDFTAHDFFVEFESASSSNDLAGRISYSSVCKRGEYIYYRIQSDKSLTLNAENHIDIWSTCKADYFTMAFERLMKTLKDSLSFHFLERELHLDFEGNLLILERTD